MNEHTRQGDDALMLTDALDVSADTGGVAAESSLTTLLLSMRTEEEEVALDKQLPNDLSEAHSTQ